MATGGILRRVTNQDYYLYDEREELVGGIHHVPVPNYTDKEGWYGRHQTGHVTPLHPDKYKAARELMDYHGRTRADLGLEP